MNFNSNENFEEYPFYKDYELLECFDIEEFNDWFCWYLRGKYYNSWFYNGDFDYYFHPRFDSDKITYLIKATGFNREDDYTEINHKELDKLIRLYCSYLLKHYKSKLSEENIVMLQSVIESYSL